MNIDRKEKSENLVGLRREELFAIFLLYIIYNIYIYIYIYLCVCVFLSRANSLTAKNNIRSIILEIKTTDVKSLKY